MFVYPTHTWCGCADGRQCSQWRFQEERKRQSFQPERRRSQRLMNINIDVTGLGYLRPIGNFGQQTNVINYYFRRLSLYNFLSFVSIQFQLKFTFGHMWLRARTSNTRYTVYSTRHESVAWTYKNVIYFMRVFRVHKSDGKMVIHGELYMG